MINIRFHLFIVFILAFLAIHIPLIISTTNGLLEACNPYLNGCFSISRSSRQPISIYVFKPLMIISAVALYLLWPRLLKQDYKRFFLYMGQIGSIFLVIYTIALGNKGDFYEVMRKYGIFIFYIFTLFSQWAYCFSINAVKKEFFSKKGGLLFLCYFQIILFTCSIPFYIFLKNDGYIENIFEWWITLSIIIWFFLNFLYYSENDTQKRY